MDVHSRQISIDPEDADRYDDSKSSIIRPPWLSHQVSYLSARMRLQPPTGAPLGWQCQCCLPPNTLQLVQKNSGRLVQNGGQLVQNGAVAQ